MLYSVHTGIITFLLIIFIGGTIAIVTVMYYLGKESKEDHLDQDHMHSKTPVNHHNSTMNRVAKEKKEISLRKRGDNKMNMNTNQNTSTTVNNGFKDKELERKEAELKKREAELDDREMALSVALDELIELKNKVDKIIKDQKEELFSYCSVSEESALKMKEVTLEVQKNLKETIEKIQEK